MRRAVAGSSRPGATAAPSPAEAPRLAGSVRFFLIRVGALFVLVMAVFVGYISSTQWLLTLAALGLLIVAIANFWAKPNTFGSAVSIVQCWSFSASSFLLAKRNGRSYLSLVHIDWSAAHILSLAAFALSTVGFAIGVSIALRSNRGHR